MSNRVIHFEIHAGDPERAQAFYQTVFGWTFQQWMEEPRYWGITTAGSDGEAPGIDGGLIHRRGETPHDGVPVNAYTCAVQVDDYETAHDRIIEAGGSVAVPRQAIPGVAWVGYYKDTEGNIFGINQPDPQVG